MDAVTGVIERTRQRLTSDMDDAAEDDKSNLLRGDHLAVPNSTDPSPTPTTRSTMPNISRTSLGADPVPEVAKVRATSIN